MRMLLTAESITQSDMALVVNHTLRSGQQVEHEGSVIILGDVHVGAEVSATGNIIVWGSLHGVAHAGSQGDQSATIRALRMEPLQLRLAGLLARKPDRPQPIGGSAMTDTQQVHPEEARIVRDEIRLFSL